MFVVRSLAFIVLLLSLFTAVARSEDTRKDVSPEPASDFTAFQELLAGVDETSIHSALHRWSNKFRDGIFSKDRTAIEAVHSENPHLATKLVHLAKRQRSNSTTTTSRRSTSETSTTKTSSSEAESSKPAEPTALPTSSGAVLTTTNSEGSSIESTVSGGTEALPTQESSFRRVSSTVLSTTTLPNGEQSTVTGFTVVNAPNTDLATPTGSAGANPSNAGSGSPSLQSGAASASTGLKKEMLAMMGGAVAVAMALQ